MDVFNSSVNVYIKLTIMAGGRVPRGLVDLTARTTYSMIDQKPKTPRQMGRRVLPIRLGACTNTGTVTSHFFILGASHLMINPRCVVGDWQSSHQPVNRAAT